MKRWVVTTIAVFSPVVGAVPTPSDIATFAPIAAERPTRSQFVSTVKVTILETSPEQRNRAQRLVREQLVNTLSTFPALRNVPYEISSRGNEVVLSMVTQQDILAIMKEAVPVVFSGLNGRLRTHGLARVFRASFDQPTTDDRGFLEVVLDDTRTKVQSIAAQAVPLRDLLKELQAQLGTLSYMLPGECGSRVVDWRFGGAVQPNASPKEVDTLMHELATFFGLHVDRTHGTFMFTGVCNKESPTMARMAPMLDSTIPNDLFVSPPTVVNEFPSAEQAQPIPIGARNIGNGMPIRAARPAVFWRLRPFE